MTDEPIDERGPYTCCRCTEPTWNDDDWCDACVAEAAKENESPALSPPAEGEIDIEPMNMGLVRSAIYGVITDAVFGALKAEGEVVTGDYGKVWDACNEAAETLMNGKCPQVSAPDRPYTDAFATPTPAPVDWTVVGPKLVEALIDAREHIRGSAPEWHYATQDAVKAIDAALAAAQPESQS